MEDCSGGIVEIPLAEIEEVSEIGGHANAVAVTRKAASKHVCSAPTRPG
jgi:hypothetical protein